MEGKSPEAGEDLEARKCLSSLATSVAESKMGSPPSVASVFPVAEQMGSRWGLVCGSPEGWKTHTAGVQKEGNLQKGKVVQVGTKEEERW